MGAPSQSGTNFSVTSDGERFIFVKESGASLNVVLNWFEELKRVR